MSFASFPIDSLGLSQSQLAACNRASLRNAEDVLLPSASDLNRKLKYSTIQAVHDLVQSVSMAIVPSANRMDELLEDMQHGQEGFERESGGMFLATGDQGMDAALGGGLRIGALTEIVGESASGKSHLTMSLALAAQLPSLSRQPGGTIILTSEREVPGERLNDLAERLIMIHASESSTTAKHLLDNIRTHRVEDIDKLEHMLSYPIPFALRSCRTASHSPLIGQRPPRPNAHAESSTSSTKKPLPIRLLIIDSITALLRGEGSYSSSASGLSQRSKYICAIADKLKALAVEYELAVVVINQVSDVFARPNEVISPPGPTPTSSFAHQAPSQFHGLEPPMLYATQSRWFSGQSASLRKEASLGIVWANAVNTRIMLSRTGRRRLLHPIDLMVSKKRRRHGSAPQDIGASPGLEVDTDSPTLIRRMHVVFSPFGPSSTIDYIISPSGVHSLPGSHRRLDSSDAIKRRAENARLALARQANDDKEEGDDGDEEPKDGGAGNVDIGRQEDFGGDEVFDDLGDLPAEFWDGKWEEEFGDEEEGGSRQRTKVVPLDDG